MSSRSTQIIGGPARQHALVTNTGALHVTMGDTPSIDAFDRLRVSNPLTILDSILKYGKDEDAWNEELTAGATSVHQFDEASVLMTVSTSGDKVVRQTREYYRYQPGKSQLVMMTFNIQSGGDTTNVRRRSGYFDAENGIFLELTSAGIGIVKRSNVTGTPVDTRIEQADWNLDPLPDFDTTKTHILAIDLQWLGVGRVRVGFVIDGLITYAHQFNHANIESSVYMTTAQLPCRHEIEATGVPTGAATLRHICTAIMSEGGRELFDGIPHSTLSGAPAAVSGTLIPVLSIRPKALFEGEVNRVQIIQRAAQVINSGNGVAEVHVIFDGALTGAVFASVESDSTMEFDTTATAITGGHHIQMFYVPSSNQASAAIETQLIGKLRLSLDIAGANPTNLTIAVTNHGTVTAAAALTWQEYQ
jgi:hypothetical protein